MNKTEKTAQIGEIKARFDGSVAAVLIDFKGLNVGTVTDLRRAFRKQGVEYKVLKNTVIRHALKDSAYSGAVGKLGGGGARTAHKSLQGMTGVAWCKEDPSAAAKVIKTFKTDKGPKADKLQVKAGLLGGQVRDGAWVIEEMSKLPGLKEVQAQLLATIMAPAQNVVAIINAPGQNLAYAFDALKRKLDGGAGEGA